MPKSSSPRQAGATTTTIPNAAAATAAVVTITNDSNKNESNENKQQQQQSSPPKNTSNTDNNKREKKNNKTQEEKDAQQQQQNKTLPEQAFDYIFVSLLKDDDQFTQIVRKVIILMYGFASLFVGAVPYYAYQASYADDTARTPLIVLAVTSFIFSLVMCLPSYLYMKITKEVPDWLMIYCLVLATLITISWDIITNFFPVRSTSIAIASMAIVARVPYDEFLFGVLTVYYLLVEIRDAFDLPLRAPNPYEGTSGEKFIFSFPGFFGMLLIPMMLAAVIHAHFSLYNSATRSVTLAQDVARLLLAYNTRGVRKSLKAAEVENEAISKGIAKRKKKLQGEENDKNNSNDESGSSDDEGFVQGPSVLVRKTVGADLIKAFKKMADNLDVYYPHLPSYVLPDTSGSYDSDSDDEDDTESNDTIIFSDDGGGDNKKQQQQSSKSQKKKQQRFSDAKNKTPQSAKTKNQKPSYENPKLLQEENEEKKKSRRKRNSLRGDFDSDDNENENETSAYSSPDDFDDDLIIEVGVNDERGGGKGRGGRDRHYHSRTTTPSTAHDSDDLYNSESDSGHSLGKREEEEQEDFDHLNSTDFGYSGSGTKLGVSSSRTAAAGAGAGARLSSSNSRLGLATTDNSTPITNDDSDFDQHFSPSPNIKSSGYQTGKLGGGNAYKVSPSSSSNSMNNPNRKKQHRYQDKRLDGYQLANERRSRAAERHADLLRDSKFLVGRVSEKVIVCKINLSKISSKIFPFLLSLVITPEMAEKMKMGDATVTAIKQEQQQQQQEKPREEDEGGETSTSGQLFQQQQDGSGRGNMMTTVGRSSSSPLNSATVLDAATSEQQQQQQEMISHSRSPSQHSLSPRASDSAPPSTEKLGMPMQRHSDAFIIDASPSSTSTPPHTNIARGGGGGIVGGGTKKSSCLGCDAVQAAVDSYDKIYGQSSSSNFSPIQQQQQQKQQQKQKRISRAVHEKTTNIINRIVEYILELSSKLDATVHAMIGDTIIVSWNSVGSQLQQKNFYYSERKVARFFLSLKQAIHKALTGQRKSYATTALMMELPSCAAEAADLEDRGIITSSSAASPNTTKEKTTSPSSSGLAQHNYHDRNKTSTKNNNDDNEHEAHLHLRNQQQQSSSSPQQQRQSGGGVNGLMLADLDVTTWNEIHEHETTAELLSAAAVVGQAWCQVGGNLRRQMFMLNGFSHQHVLDEGLKIAEKDNFLVVCRMIQKAIKKEFVLRGVGVVPKFKNCPKMCKLQQVMLLQQLKQQQSQPQQQEETQNSGSISSSSSPLKSSRSQQQEQQNLLPHQVVTSSGNIPPQPSSFIGGSSSGSDAHLGGAGSGNIPSNNRKSSLSIRSDSTAGSGGNLSNKLLGINNVIMMSPVADDKPVALARAGSGNNSRTVLSSATSKTRTSSSSSSDGGGQEETKNKNKKNNTPTAATGVAREIGVPLFEVICRRDPFSGVTASYPVNFSPSSGDQHPQQQQGISNSNIWLYSQPENKNKNSSDLERTSSSNSSNDRGNTSISAANKVSIEALVNAVTTTSTTSSPIREKKASSSSSLLSNPDSNNLLQQQEQEQQQSSSFMVPTTETGLIEYVSDMLAEVVICIAREQVPQAANILEKLTQQIPKVQELSSFVQIDGMVKMMMNLASPS